jgi:hypothetical protein
VHRFLNGLDVDPERHGHLLQRITLKTGRPPKDPSGRKSEPYSLRLSPDLRARLDEERNKADPSHSLSQEIESRLRQSFIPGQGFHDRRTYFLAKAIDDGIANFIEPLVQRRCWEDPYAFDQVYKMINELLKMLKPKGKRIVPKRFDPKEADTHRRWLQYTSVGAAVAEIILHLHLLGARGEGLAPPQYERAGSNIAGQARCWLRGRKLNVQKIVGE